jgi:hypothetical protein
MRRGSLFFIGVLSTIVTIISLNVAFGSPGYFNERYPFYNRYHHCNSRYDDRYHDDKKYNDEKQQTIDSTNSNY